MFLCHGLCTGQVLTSETRVFSFQLRFSSSLKQTQKSKEGEGRVKQSGMTRGILACTIAHALRSFCASKTDLI